MTATPDLRTADAEALVDEVVQTKEELRDDARARLGVTGDSNTERLRAALKTHRLSVYPLLALGLLNIVDGLQGYAFTVLTPEISRSLGVGLGAITGAVAIKALAGALAPLGMAALTTRKARRALLCILTGAGWSLMTLFTGVVTSFIGLLLVQVGDGLTSGSVVTLHQPLLMDSYHPSIRVRVMSGYAAMIRLGSLISPLLIALLAGPLNLTWRGVFIVLGVFSTLSTLFALRLRDPGFGHWDTERLRDAVHEHHGESTTLAPQDVSLGFWEICRRVLLIKTIKRLLAGFAVLGVLTIPYTVFLSFFLDEKWDLSPSERGLFFAFEAAVSMVALLVYGRRGEREFRESPAKVLSTTGWVLSAALVFIALGGLSPTFPLSVTFFGLASASLGILGPALGISIFSIVPAQMRPHTAALMGIFTASGAIAGALLLGGIDRRFGIGGAMVAITAPGILGAIVIASAGRFINADLDRMIDEVLEDEEIRRITTSGGHLPMLACRGLDFSYGQLQVLFDVNFTVDDGEMVALLGVNGAGKSTLLKVVSGIGLPSKGSVRYRGQDITYLDAERRVKLGITQVPGGRAVFGPMTVVENLRSFGFTVAGDRRRLDGSINECFEAFPRLAERRNSLASTLSGGEQQMLGLSKALILQPRLLLIDELSLGLAPVIVGQLLEMVRRINAGGTAIVLVEQSVNIALNLVDHAYFMEKGEMRFDGQAQDLLARDDLLRAVFLHGTKAAGA